MARREFQMPSVQRQEGPRPYWYIRYRVKVLVGKNQIARREKWHTLGHCDEMGKREALRLRDEIMRGVNRQVYTIQSHIPFGDFVEIYKQEHIPTLSAGARAKNLTLLSRHIVPALGAKKLCDVDTETVQALLNAKGKLVLLGGRAMTLRTSFQVFSQRQKTGGTGTVGIRREGQF